MPHYRYRCRDCGDETHALQSFQDDPIEDCLACPGTVYRVIQRVQFKRSSRALRGESGSGHDYREDLAEYPGDPDAYVDGPRALQKLIDKRKRQGWQVGERSLSDVANAKPPAPMKSEEIVKEAYNRAAAKGFRPDNGESL